MTSEIRANPVYAAKDYPLIRKLSDDDMPATWEEWRSAFEKLEAENRQQHSIACRVRVHAGKFKAWLEANSLSGSERTRQRYAQERLDMKRARQAERRAMERMPIVFPEMPRRVESDQTNTRSFGLIHAVIAGLVLAWLAHHWLG
ncbi:hypothetical protein [Mesorhizobium sp. GbtcB19]|uniref:hypothetical protein n=1 Tax=Mesorhizobium sp. GbtcB19 TaxID=2824764 RepID=UPI001C30D548|nr:hypothetical protein [Mesorhizobium sp. GbtcB19]